MSRFTLSQAQSVSCHELLVVYGQSILNSNRTKHKPRKKLANQKRRHMYFRQFCPIRSYPAPGSTKPLCYTGYALYRRFRASATKATWFKGFFTSAVAKHSSIFTDLLTYQCNSTSFSLEYGSQISDGTSCSDCLSSETIRPICERRLYTPVAPCVQNSVTVAFRLKSWSTDSFQSKNNQN